MINKEYYEEKRQKLFQKFAKLKDTCLSKHLAADDELIAAQKEINEELQEIDNILKGKGMENEVKEVTEVTPEVVTEATETTTETTETPETAPAEAPVAE